MFKELLKKRVAGASSYLETGISIMVISAFFVGLVYTYGAGVMHNDVERIHRKYLLSMEIEGYLSDANEALLRAELASEGVVNVDLSGTTKAPVGYGNQVRLVIKGDLPVKQINFDSGFGIMQEALRNVNMDDTGTALY